MIFLGEHPPRFCFDAPLSQELDSAVHVVIQALQEVL